MYNYVSLFFNGDAGLSTLWLFHGLVFVAAFDFQYWIFEMDFNMEKKRLLEYFFLGLLGYVRDAVLFYCLLSVTLTC